DAQEGAPVSASSCARLREVLPLYLEHEVDPAEALEAARHLASCEACSAEADRGRAVTAALRHLAEPAPRTDLSAGVMARLRVLRARAAGSAALKWSAIGMIVGFILAEAALPTPVRRFGIRLLTTLGELIDADYLVSRLLDSASRLLPSPSS